MVEKKRRPRRRNGEKPLTREEFLLALRDMREEFAGRFEAMDHKFEQRFEAMDEKFEKRFEAIDHRFEAIDHRFEAMDLRFENLHDWVTLVVGRLQTRAGKRLEDTVAGALRLALGMEDVTPEQVRLRQKIQDPEGRIAPRGREYEFDILIRSGETYVFEVKSTPEVEDVVRFDDKATLVLDQLRPKIGKKVLVTLDKDPFVLEKARELGLLVV